MTFRGRMTIAVLRRSSGLDQSRGTVTKYARQFPPAPNDDLYIERLATNTDRCRTP